MFRAAAAAAGGVVLAAVLLRGFGLFEQAFLSYCEIPASPDLTPFTKPQSFVLLVFATISSSL
uniref:Uncharacterized protein n=1 Tax=Anguilla anguilla TaxID=7936 RepID=A0A0E9WXF9_ANGAN